MLVWKDEVVIVVLAVAYIEQIEDGFLLQYAPLHLGGQFPTKNINNN